MVERTRPKFEEQKRDDEREELARALANQFEEEKISTPPFIATLQSMLESRKHDDVIAWSENGKELVIKSMHRFKVEIFPLYFTTTAYTTFIR